MARPTRIDLPENLHSALRDTSKVPRLSEWLAAIISKRAALEALPLEGTTDFERCTAVLALAHLRYRAPIATIWQELQSPGWADALAAVDQLASPVRWSVAAGAAAMFVRSGNHAGFDVAIRILTAFRFPVLRHEEIAHGALLTCIEHRPALLGELMQGGALKRPSPLERLARTRPAALVGEIFRELEEVYGDCDAEYYIGKAIWRTRRWDVALACLAYVKKDGLNPRTPNVSKRTAAERRDRLREIGAGCMAKDGRLQEGIELLLSSENRERGVERAIDLLCDFDSPDSAFELWKDNREYRADWLLTRDLASAFAKQGRVENALETSKLFVGSKSERSDIIATALTEALEAGAVNEVASALDQVPSKRERARLEELVARAGGTLEPKQLRVRAEALVMKATSPHAAASAATRIATMLSETKAPDAIFIRAALVRALAKAELPEAINEHFLAAMVAVKGVSRKKVSNEAAAAVFAASIAAGRVLDGLAMLESIAEKFEDHHEVSDFLFDVVETCGRAGVIEQLKVALPTGSDAWLVEQFNEVLTWQGVSEGKVDQLVSKAMKQPREADRNFALGEIIRDLEARKQYPEALAVLRRMEEPHSPLADRIGLGRRAAEDGFPRVAEAILDIVEDGWRVEGKGSEWEKTPWKINQEVRERAFEVRAAFELAGGDEHALVALAEGLLELPDRAVWEAAHDWLKTGCLGFRPDSKSRGSSAGRTMLETAGSLDAAIARELLNDRKMNAPASLIELARYAATQEALIPRVAEILMHALRCLQFTEQSTSWHPRKEIADIAEFVIHGFPVPEFHSKADELMAAIANGYYLGPAHLARVLAAMGRWQEAFDTLNRIIPVEKYKPSPENEDRASTACHLLLTSPPAIIRAHASVFADHPALAWLYTAALGVRGDRDKQPGLLKKVIRPGSRKREFIELLRESGDLAGLVSG